MKRTRAVPQPACAKAQIIQCWRVTQQFPTKTIQFCTTLNVGEGREAMKTSKVLTFSTVLSMIVVLPR